VTEPRELFVVYFGDDEPEFYASQEEAVAAANQAMRELWDPFTGQYSEMVDHIFVAKILAVALECDRVDRPPKEELDDEGFDQSGIDWSDGQEYICDYKVAVLPEHSEQKLAPLQLVH
jgi:hypothetical protein